MLARIKHYIAIILKKIGYFFPRGRKKFFVLPVVGALAVMGIFAVASPAFALDIFTDLVNGLFQVFSMLMFILARLFIGVTIFALKFFVEVASYNNYIDTPTVKIGWFLVRDVANMFFVVVLLAISVGTILGIEQYEWKKTLVKLVLAAIFINFSNMIAQLIIDIAHVFTITFVNAISATAGGNIIRLFNIDSVYKITGAEKFDFGSGGNIRIETFAASVAAFFLALIMMVTMGAFALVMAARMVVLWVLIILSPLAYIFQVIPQTQKYAQEWWSQFTNHVIVAPVMVFFLWLAFATLNTQVEGLQFDSSNYSEASAVLDGGQRKLSISDATSWENLASFLIATSFLMVGLKAVRNLGVVAGGLTTSAEGFAKRVATIATGYAVGRGIYERGKAEAGDAFSDYTRLLKGQTIGRLRNNKYVKEVPFLGAAGKQRRKAAVSRLEKFEEAQKEQYLAEGPTKWTPAGWIAPSKTRVADQTVRTALARQAADRAGEDRENNAFVRLAADERQKFLHDKMEHFQKTFAKEMGDLGLDEEISAFQNFMSTANKSTGSQRAAALNEAAEKMKTIEGSLGRGSYTNDAGKKFAIDKDTGKKLSYDDRRSLDEKLAKGTVFYRSTLSKIREEESKGDKEAIERGLYGGFSLGYLTEERGILEENISNADKELLEERERALEKALTSGTSEEQKKAQDALRREKSNLIKRYSESAQKDLKQLAMESAKEKRDAIDPTTWQNMSEKQREKAIKKELGDDDFKKKYGDSEAIKKNLEVLASATNDDALDQGVRRANAISFQKNMMKEMRMQATTSAAKATPNWKSLSHVQREKMIDDEMKKHSSYTLASKNISNLDEGDFQKLLEQRQQYIKFENNKDIKDQWKKLSFTDKMNRVNSSLAEMNSDARNSLVKEGLYDEARKAAALSSISDQDRGIKYASYNTYGVTDGLAKLAGEYLTKQNERQDKKYASETERISAIIGDQIRMEEGKRPELKRNWEYKRAMEDLKEYDDLSLNELVDELQQNHRKIKQLADKAKLGTLKAPEEKDAYKNYSQRQMRAVASLAARFPGSAPGILGEFDSTYKDAGVTLLDPDNLHLMVGGLISGRSFSDVNNDFSGVQEDVRKALKEKADPLFRALMLGIQKAADNGFSQYYDQMKIGYDSNGTQKIGFTNAFEAGLGAGKKMGTGNLARDGRTQRDADMRSNSIPGVNINSAKDGRAYVMVDANGKALKVLSEEHRRAIRQIASLSKQSIQHMDPTKLWSMLGGSWSNSPWQNGMFQMTKDMGDVFSDVMQDFASNYSLAKSTSQKDNVLSSLKELLRQLKVDDVDGKDLGSANIKDLESFLGKQLSAMGHTSALVFDESTTPPTP